MSIIVFVVGRPGSGKSTSVRYVMELAQSEGYSTLHLRDYTILQAMSIQEEYQAKFRLNEYAGFDVLDFSVLDIALYQLEERINFLMSTKEYDVILVEFARDTYDQAFQRFSPILLKDAFFLFIEADLHVCMHRIYKRTIEIHGPDHHFLSDHIMMTYYQKDHWLYMNTFFREQFDIKEQQLKTIYNDSSLEFLAEEAERFAEDIVQEVHFRQRSHINIRIFQEMSIAC